MSAHVPEQAGGEAGQVAVAAEPEAVPDGAVVMPGLGVGGPVGVSGLRRLPPRERAQAIARLNAGGGNAAVSALIAREPDPAAAPATPAPATPGPHEGEQAGAAEDPAQIALQLNGMSMDGLLAALQARGKDWINGNRDPLVHTPGVGPQRMALAVEAVLAAPIAQDERLAFMMGEMQAMGLPDDQQDAVAKFVGAFGLRAPKAIASYLKGATALKDTWGTMSSDERAQKLGNLAAAELTSAGVPTPLSVDIEGIGEDGGLWDRKKWRIIVSSKIGSLKNDDDTFANAAATIYHEARHGEQDFEILRLLAGKEPKPTEQEIFAKYEAPSPVIQAAMANPMRSDDPAAGRAAAWLFSSTGIQLEYMNRPEERDAHGTGNTVKDRLMGGTPPDRSSQLRDSGQNVPSVSGQTGAPLLRPVPPTTAP